MVPKLKALGDESRLAILKFLATKGELCGCEIEKQFAISQSTVSHHMKILVTAHLVIERKVSRSHYYTINRNEINNLISNLQKILLNHSED
ncbi:MAG TPA: metalloregulator ArsR/SmtB family transcription factor [Candidatus Ligilactobacillus avistercoris]|nr:metalloregulator ArsR/SmtB family transcription factor [Candidatus Ligilactobacillus avistercoris]